MSMILLHTWSLISSLTIISASITSLVSFIIALTIWTACLQLPLTVAFKSNKSQLEEHIGVTTALRKLSSPWKMPFTLLYQLTILKKPSPVHELHFCFTLGLQLDLFINYKTLPRICPKKKPFWMLAQEKSFIWVYVIF